MAHTGGRHPEGFVQRSARTLFLRAPYSEWATLTLGAKTELRTTPMGAIAEGMVAPTPVVLYATTRQSTSPHALMVVTARRRERLADIAQDSASLRAEGCETYKQFRHYWRQRTHRPYVPLEEVEVWSLALWGAVSPEVLGQSLLTRLYGAYMAESS